MKIYLQGIKTVLFLIVFAMISGLSFAQSNDSIRAEIEALKAKIAELEERLARQEQKSKEQERELAEIEEQAFTAFDGLNINVGATFVLQSTIDANATPKKGEDATDGTYSMDLEIEKEFEDYARAFIHLEAGSGGGLDSDELRLFSAVNRDAGDSENRVEVTELWYEHYLLDKKFSFTFGKLDPSCYLDENAIANDETTQFLSAAFRNSAALEFPDENALALVLTFVPLECIELTWGIFDDNADWEDIADNTFLFGQVNFRPHILQGEGNYRFYAWHDNSFHTKLRDPSKNKEANYGFGLSFDQQLTDILSCFVRFGWEDPAVSNIEYAWSMGAEINARLWNRSKDRVGIAIGANIPSDDYAEAGNPDEPEGHFELYYNFQVNEHLSLSPDIQVIWNPNGVGSGERDDTVTVLGLRAQVDF